MNGFTFVSSRKMTKREQEAYDIGYEIGKREAVKHGQWEQSEDEYYALCVIKCSNCKEEYCFDVSDDVEQLNYHYCPNCGTKMDLKEEK